MRVEDFPYAHNFPNLTTERLDSAIREVEIMFYGVQTLFRIMPHTIGNLKRQELLNLLVAWFLATRYPDEVIGITSQGDIPLASKSINDIHLSYRDIIRQAGGLESLLVNQFGVQALLMLQVVPEAFMLMP